MELTVKLKQHTPIIHFQWDQMGATLRATELKPKLDRYIKKINGLPHESRLQYQIKIKPIGYAKKDEPDKNLYFGDIGQTGRNKKTIIYESGINLIFNTYFDSNIKGQIEKSLPVCLALENFGMRNNKGFGCFFIEGKQIDEFEKILKTNASSQVYYWDCSKRDSFFSIKTVYSLLKSGINLRDRNGNNTYYKSLLFSYFKNQNITWDKKAIKLHFGLITRNDDKWVGQDEKFVRAFLGVSELQEWKIPYNKTLKITSDDFERVPSPLVFKVFDNGNNTVRIYFWARTDFYNKLFNKAFTFSIGSKTKKLFTPSHFDLVNYLYWAVNEINCKLVINSSDATSGIVKRTDDILNTIKRNGINPL